MDRNSQKWSRKCCHSLPFAAKVSDRCSFEQFHNLNKRQGSFPHHSIPPCNLYKWKVFLTACRNTAAYCIILLTVWNSWLRQQISKIPSLYELSLSFRWNDEGKQAVKTKAECFKCFKAWRLFLCSSSYLSIMHHWPSVRSVWLDIWPNSFFCILLDFLEVLYFFLVGYATRLRRSFGRCGTSCIEARLRSLLRTYERSTCSKSSILFTETSRGP